MTELHPMYHAYRKMPHGDLTMVVVHLRYPGKSTLPEVAEGAQLVTSFLEQKGLTLGMVSFLSQDCYVGIFDRSTSAKVGEIRCVRGKYIVSE